MTFLLRKLRLRNHRLAGWLGILAFAGGCATPPSTLHQSDEPSIDNIVIIYAENRSFDHLFGLFPGAEGIANATREQKIQRDHDGTPLKELLIFDKHGKPDPAFPRLLNGPFRIDAPPLNRPLDQLGPNPIHSFYYNREQINGGRNDRFAAMSNVGGWVMGYYDGSPLKLWQWAQEYTLADHFFMAAYGGSYLNHFWLICACTPRHPDAPTSMQVRMNVDGLMTKKSHSPSANLGAVKVEDEGLMQVTHDGWSVNTTQPPYQPSGIPPAKEGPRTHANPQGLETSKGLQVPLPPQTQTTIGDTLSAKGIAWTWYAGAWQQALDDGMQEAQAKRRVINNRDPGSPNFQPHHHPFNYFARYAPGTREREAHLKDATSFWQDIQQGTLPPVSFYKPAGMVNQHPGYTDVLSGDAHMDDILSKLRASPQWPKMLIIVTYDENGGFWDHVPPPSGPGWSDVFGPGSRIPTLFIGPMVKKGFVDHTWYDTTSILKWITQRFDLEPLPGVRTHVGNFSNAMEVQ
ncbi:MAG: acid phosphatase [Magnetococcales bacterium]|nr:acid phosphatase [Magnetococcales bacterium]MBF0150159.1 acid phosphatase [Magnetococcales bacterium]